MNATKFLWWYIALVKNGIKCISMNLHCTPNKAANKRVISPFKINRGQASDRATKDVIHNLHCSILTLTHHICLSKGGDGAFHRTCRPICKCLGVKCSVPCKFHKQSSKAAYTRSGESPYTGAPEAGHRAPRSIGGGSLSTHNWVPVL